MPKVKTINDDLIAVKYIKNLRIFRKKAKLTQTELGLMAGVSTDTISRYERHEGDVPVSTYNILADIFRWPHYKQSPNETLSLDFENPKQAEPKQAEPKQAENPCKEFIYKAQLAELRAIAGIKGCSVSELLDKLIAPYAEALNALRSL